MTYLRFILDGFRGSCTCMIALCKETSFLLLGAGTITYIFMANRVMAILTPDLQHLHIQKEHVTAASLNPSSCQSRKGESAHFDYRHGGEDTFLGLS